LLARQRKEAAEEIISHFDIPVVYPTALADENTLQRAKVTEPYGYISKPFVERELRAVIVNDNGVGFPRDVDSCLHPSAPAHQGTVERSWVDSPSRVKRWQSR